jgi:hypothetical protein
MADTDPRYSLPGALRERLEAAAREEATTPDELIAQAVAALLQKRSWERRMDRLNAVGRRSAAAIGVTEENLDDRLHEWRQERRDQGGPSR